MGMNIFYLDSDPVLCAQYHCDKHLVKMLVEHCQLLSTAIRLNGIDDIDLYKITHKNHPSAIWVRESRENFIWLCELTSEMFKEYTIRYNKSHKSFSVFEKCLDYIHCIPNGSFTNIPQCMPDDCKSDNPVIAYRQYYIKYKSHFAKWKTKTPEWYND
jgi:hypothetical protein